ncbi:glycosyltransferase family 4 protein [Nocardioides caricicola]|uniref:Glycosyltransferase family 4 protein n=1 Tax=Nocardioides caricicola TaxID=634770 RepID=A0ABW0MY86_9ACTN
MGSSPDISRARPVIVQHSFGDPGSGGPVGALQRILDSDLGDRYEWVRMHQEWATGGIDVSRVRSWARMLREVRPDLVHVRGLGNEGFHGVLAARLARCPRVLVSMHGTVRDLTTPATLKQRALVGVFEPATLRLATHVTTVCEYAAERDFIRKHAGKFVGPITNGVDPVVVDPGARSALRSELGLAPEDVALVSVGRLTFEKGHTDLAAALGRLEPHVREQVVLVVVGSGPDEEAIRDGYATAGVRTAFLGRRLDVPQLLASSDVFVFPSLHENLSNALLEAMAQGLPVVATRVGGNTEVVRRGGGLLVEARDPAGLAEAIGSLVADRARREGLGVEAAGVAARHYSTRRMLEILDETYRAVLSDGRR